MRNEMQRDDKADHGNDDDDRNQDDSDDVDQKPVSAPTRAGSNVPNAGRDPDEGRTE